MSNKKHKIGITFGTYDLLHVGHVRIFQRAKNLCENLIVGVSSDSLNFKKKSTFPIYNENDRMEIVRSISYVDDVFLEESLEEKIEYIKKYNADVLFMGDDWKGKFDFCNELCEVVYLSRTKNISTSETVNSIKKN
jgi:glycerol-3-phosphate cytidylyltransferase